FRNRSFKAYWFETGTPTFLIETLLSRGVSSLALDNMLGSDDLLSAFDVDHIATEALLFQTGYLTIIQTEPRGGEMYYRLSYPNREVRQSLNRSLLNHLTGDPSQRTEHRARLYDLLLVNDFASLESLFKAFFASIPYQWHTNNDIANYEGYYASVFYSYFASVGFDIVVEDSSSDGRLDMAVRFNDNVYLFEFKVMELAPEGTAMVQLQAKGYADKYRDLGEPIHLIGVEFSRETRNLIGFETALA
ncbi:MAG: PD-(D/E)XK nuclease domain-containing protein, partial [Gemmatimonadetes bacterium]|nr:PD-(D/E)XK nuclease domain-containing protein [Gemmatimonadota bacterium]